MYGRLDPTDFFSQFGPWFANSAAWLEALEFHNSITMPSVGELFAAYILLASIIAGSTALHAAMEDMCYESVLDRRRKRDFL